MNIEEGGPQSWNDVKNIKGMGWRIIFSVLTVIIWLSFIMAWLFFRAGDYSVWENIGILMASLLVFLAINAAVWIPFGMKFAPASEREKYATMKGILSGAIVLGLFIVLIFWLILYADDYNIYQNIAVFLLLLFIGGGLNALLWIGERDCWTR